MEKLKGARLILYVALGYLLIIIVLTWPLLTVMKGKIVNDELNVSPDIEGTLWFHWWVKHAILTHQNKYFCDLIYYPVGRNLLMLFKNALDCFLAFPFYCLFGFPAYYNVLCMLVMAFNGLAVFLLARHFVKHNGIAFLTGFLVTFCHFVLFEMQNGRIIQMTIGLPALYILFFVKTMEEDSAANVLALSLVFLLSCLMYWYYGIFLLTFSVLYLIFFAITKKKMLTRALFIRMVLTFALFVVMVLPLTLPFIKQLKTYGGIPETPFLEKYPPLSEILRADVVTEPRKNAIVTAARLDRDLFLYPIALVALGFFLPLIRVKRADTAWVLTTLSLFSIALGPYLVISGTPYNVKLPFYYLYTFVPLFSRFFWPLRIMSVVIVLMGLLFAKSMDFICERYSLYTKKIKIVPAAALLCSIIFIFSFTEIYMRGAAPMKLQRVAIPRFFKYLSHEKDCAIIEVPFLSCPKSIIYQMVHRKKILGGPGITVSWDHPDEFVRFWKSNTFLVYLNNLNNLSISEGSYRADDLERLRLMGFRYIIFYEKHCREAVFQNIRREDEQLEEMLSIRIQKALANIFGTPIYEGEGIVVYDIGKPSQ